MKKKIICAVCAAVVLVAAAGGISWWKSTESIRFVRNMGAGVNLGNTLDSRGVREYMPDADDLAFESAWGNPRADEETFEAMADAGFHTVRIPVTWMDHMDENGQVSEVWMNRVQEVVDMALAQDLYVILNTHHEEWMNLETDREEEITAQFQSLWEQIAGRFAEYDEKLLFESMNEPRLRNSQYEWNAGSEELRDMVNRLNQVFLNTVRESGGRNKSRYLLICPYGSSPEREAMEAVTGMDRRTILSVHMYTPYTFCQKEDGDSTWDDAAGTCKAEIAKSFEAMGEIFVQNGIPVILTEFGCIDRDNTPERAAWTECYVQLAKDNGVGYIWWDCGDFRLLDRNSKTWVFPEIVEVLTGKIIADVRK